MTSDTRDLSDKICRYIAECPHEQLPEAARLAAARVILDATGVMLAASGLSPETRPFVASATVHGDTGPCHIFGYDHTVDAPMAAFANGAMAHALDFEDAFDAAPCHPNAATIPAAIAVAEAFGPVAGRDFVTAVTLGCDLVCRMGLCLRQPMEENGWYPPPILGAFGATAAAARLFGLDALQVKDALSLVLCQTTMPGEIMHSRGTVIRAVREAFPAHAAVLAALLARHGVRGFEAPLEGDAGFFRLYADGRFEPEVLLDALGSRFHIEDLSFKPWPACRGTHAYIETALELARENRIDWRRVESVSATTGPIQRMLIEPLPRKQAPSSIIDAKFSIPFTVAIALVKGEVSLGSFNEAVLHDPDVLELAQRIHAAEDPDWGRAEAATGRLVLRLADGREISGDVARALGHPANPLTTEQLVEKFVDCCAHAARPLNPVPARELAERLLAIDSSTDSGKLFQV